MAQEQTERIRRQPVVFFRADDQTTIDAPSRQPVGGQGDALQESTRITDKCVIDSGRAEQRSDGTMDRRGVAVNELTNSADRDPIAGTPWHKYVPIKIERLPDRIDAYGR